VAGWGTVGYGEGGVEQQNALTSPFVKHSIKMYASTAGANFFKNIAQRRGDTHTCRHREGQAIGLPRSVIGVLPQHDHLDLRQGREGKGAQRLWGVHHRAFRDRLLQTTAKLLSGLGLGKCIDKRTPSDVAMPRCNVSVSERD
jgi:hypothetical protein